MSRAINVAATREEVEALSAKHDAAISAIEPLHPTGTRVVYMNGADAATLTKAFGKRVLTGAVVRTSLRPQRTSGL